MTLQTPTDDSRMHETKASNTAYRVAVRRAEHQLLDSPKVFDDPLSLRILDAETLASIQPGQISRRQRLTKSFRAYMAVRSRYTEDELAKSYHAGLRQYVVLGAGLDTFSCRNPYFDLRVFEVDHPATQAWKLERLAAGGIQVPGNATFVPADFEHHTLREELTGTGFDFDQPTFFSWLGVVPYLTESAFLQTMQFVAALPEGTVIVFDYGVPMTMLNPVQKKALDALSTRVKNLGEPFRLFYEPQELRERLEPLGFHLTEDLGREELNARYFTNRVDELRVKANLARLVHATR